MDADSTNSLFKDGALFTQDVSISPPLFGLPVELWGEIFDLSLPVDARANQLEFITPSPASPPLLISQICREWRSIALSTPSLWARLAVKVTSRTSIDFIALWLSRSASFPLSLQWYQSIPNPAFFILFASHLNHWRYLKLYIRRNIPFLPDIPPEGAPMLEHMSIFVRPHDHKFVQWLCSIMYAAPRLKYVHGPINTPLDLPWARLSSIVIYVPSLDQALDYLACASRLIDCTFSFPAQLRHESIRRPHIVLPCLNHLCTVARPGDVLSLVPFFDHLTLPALKSFFASGWFSHPFLSLLSRSPTCPLSSLTLSRTPLSDSLLLECLRHSCLQSLSDLKVSYCEDAVTDRILDFLTFRNEHEHLLPKLETLEFSYCIRSTDGLLADMVKSRSPSRLLPAGVNSLTKVTVGGLDDVDHENDLSRLRALRTEGLLVEEFVWI